MKRARAVLHRQGTRRFDATASYVHDTFEQDIEIIVSHLQQAGLGRVTVVDLTKREYGIPVFRVIVPGLETSRRIDGYVPGPRARPVLDRLISESRP